jgi:hypothetical protein
LIIHNSYFNFNGIVLRKIRTFLNLSVASSSRILINAIHLGFILSLYSTLLPFPIQHFFVDRRITSLALLLKKKQVKNQQNSICHNFMAWSNKVKKSTVLGKTYISIWCISSPQIWHKKHQMTLFQLKFCLSFMYLQLL